MEPKPPFIPGAGGSPILVGARVGSRTSDFRNLSRPKKWLLRNTGFVNGL